MHGKQFAALARLIAVGLVGGVLAGCGSGTSSSSRNVAESGLRAIALTEAEGQAAIPGFGLYPFTPPNGIVSNDAFLENGSTGDPTLDRSLVEEFHRTSGYHVEGFSDTDDDLRATIETDLYTTPDYAHGAYEALSAAFSSITPTGLDVSGTNEESVGDEGWSFRAGVEGGWHVNVLVFRRAKLVVTVAIAGSDENGLLWSRALAETVDAKIRAAIR